MSTTASVTATADDGDKGLTLDEIGVFVARAKAAGISGDAVPAFHNRTVDRYDYLYDQPRQVEVLASLSVQTEEG